MTIDISIGKLKFKSFKDVINVMLDDEYSYNYKQTFNLVQFLEVEQCPDDIDGCSKNDTMCPNSAYRSGSSIGITSFFRDVDSDLFLELKPIRSNDLQITRIKPYLKRINELTYNGTSVINHKRLEWLKFWCNRAVELYSDKAVISFS